MLRTGQNRPSTANKSSNICVREWRHFESEVILSSNSDGTLNFSVIGGSDSGEFSYVSDIQQNKVNYTCGCLNEGDIVLEVQGQKVAGYTQRDVVAWLNHCCKDGNPVTLRTLPAGTITKDLRQFLNTRFPKGSESHELQNIIRDNVYLRTVPVTTREPREGEVNGLDYVFLTLEQFMLLESNASLLESGIYEGNHYGTPKPSKEPSVSPPQSGGVNWHMPGAHPSSEGKRKRNRSNVEAMSAKDMDPPTHDITDGHDDKSVKPMNATLPCYVDTGEFEDANVELGPLPSNWEKAYTEKGEAYFIDHNTGTSHWLDPRLSKIQKKSLEECLDDELPYGWEKIEDPHYGTYYIDHVNRKTQYENPVILAKQQPHYGSKPPSQLSLKQPQHLALDPQDPQHSYRDAISEQEKNDNYPSYVKTGSENGSHQQNMERYHQTGSGFEKHQPYFTRNPDELRGERFTTVLVKSSRGLGFTIVGGDETVEEFLQIKSVVPNGPAWLDGKLQTGDVLVYVNDTCMLGYTHHDMVNVFQSIVPGETVKLEVCRGYPLPFDPNDPNTEVVTTVAVGAPDSVAGDIDPYLDEEITSKIPSELFNNSVDGNINHMRSNSDDMLNTSVKSMPDLCATEKVKNMQRPSSTDVLLDDPSRIAEDYFNEPPAIPEKPEFLSISILKGPMGFGFTIADSAYGQKVKKILDRVRCKNLMEGDILVDINMVNVRNMCHSDVVQVLKDCERNQEATVTVQRGPNSPSKQRLKKKEFAVQAPGVGPYRSKTPTADLYSTQQKEVMPNRPKTPLVDTRNRSKTPVLRSWNNDEVKLSSSGLYKLSSQEHFLNERLAMTNLNDDQEYQKRESLSRENHYAKNDPFSREKLIQNDGQNMSQGMLDLDGLQKHPSMSYYNGYMEDSYGYPEDYHMYNPNDYVLKPVVHAHPRPPYYHNDQMVDGYLPTHHKDAARFPQQLKMPGGSRGHQAFEQVETIVSLLRQETGFGFRIVGGSEEGSQVGSTVSIGHIVPGGAADLDGRLCTGDEIVSVDGQSVINTSHHHVVQLMGKAAASGSVAIGIRRRIPLPLDGQPMILPSSGYPYDVTVTRREDEGFGFVIISSLNRTGSTIGRIIKGSPAERCGQLHVGDHILAVNRFDITTLHHGDIVNLIKDSGFSVTLTIGPPFEDTSSNASVSQREELDGDEGYEGGRRGRNFDYGPMRSPRDGLGPLLEDEQYHAVELSRGSRGFGFSIRGGKEFHNMPLYVLQIAESGPAAVNDKLKIGDQIIEINGINTKNMTHAEAIEIIRKGGPTVRLLVRRGEKPPPPPPPPPHIAPPSGDY